MAGGYSRASHPADGRLVWQGEMECNKACPSVAPSLGSLIPTGRVRTLRSPGTVQALACCPAMKPPRHFLHSSKCRRRNPLQRRLPGLRVRYFVRLLCSCRSCCKSFPFQQTLPFSSACLRSLGDELRLVASGPSGVRHVLRLVTGGRLLSVTARDATGAAREVQVEPQSDTALLRCDSEPAGLGLRIRALR